MAASAEPVSFIREVECGGSVLKLHQDLVGDVGCIVWDAALVFGRFLENDTFFTSDYWSSKRVIELGSGTGAVGLMAALLGCEINNIIWLHKMQLLCVTYKIASSRFL